MLEAQITWEGAKVCWLKKFIKRREKKEKQLSDDALFAKGGAFSNVGRANSRVGRGNSSLKAHIATKVKSKSNLIIGRMKEGLNV